MSTATTKRTRSRRGEGDRLRAEILDAAGEILARTGNEDAVSIRAVATAVGVTPPSIYLHFADKDELLQEVCSAKFEAFDAELEQAGAGSDDPLESLRRRAHAYVRFGLDHPEHYRILFLTRPAADRVHEMSGVGAQAFAHLVAAVAQCVETGAFAPTDPEGTARVLWAAMHGITSLLIARPGFPWPDVDALVSDVLAVVEDGLRPRR